MTPTGEVPMVIEAHGPGGRRGSDEHGDRSRPHPEGARERRRA